MSKSIEECSQIELMQIMVRVQLQIAAKLDVIADGLANVLCCVHNSDTGETVADLVEGLQALQATNNVSEHGWEMFGMGEELDAQMAAQMGLDDYEEDYYAHNQ